MINKDDPNYETFVDDHDKTGYDIFANKLQEGESVVCPHDSDMCISNVNGQIVVSKKCYVKNPFIK